MGPAESDGLDDTPREAWRPRLEPDGGVSAPVIPRAEATVSSGITIDHRGGEYTDDGRYSKSVLLLCEGATVKKKIQQTVPFMVVGTVEKAVP